MDDCDYSHDASTPEVAHSQLVSRSVVWGTIFWNHTGLHSGMAPLSREIETVAPSFIDRVEGTRKKPTLSDTLKNGARRMLQLARPTPEWIRIGEQVPFYDDKSYALEQKICRIVPQTKPFAVVLESIDAQLFLLARERVKWPRTRLIGICHQPPAWWKLNHSQPDIVKSLDLLIVVASHVKGYWEQFIDRQKIVFIAHGVDSEFFAPLTTERKLSSTDKKLHVVFSGQWLRDFETMEGVVAIADKLNLPVCFEMIVPRFSRGTDSCYRIAMSPRVHWHSSLTDEALRALYRQSDLLLLTLRDSTANNGLLEGMACGLPVIVTDVGGVRDYANENFAYFVPPRDAASIIEIIRGHLAERAKLMDRGAAARAHVEKHLSWRRIAREYIDLLRTLR